MEYVQTRDEEISNTKRLAIDVMADRVAHARALALSLVKNTAKARHYYDLDRRGCKLITYRRTVEQRGPLFPLCRNGYDSGIDTWRHT